LDYKLHYNLLIEKSKNREKPVVYERHHILPKSMGGTDKEDNFAYLTPKEHYVAHHLLWKIYKSEEMHYAFWLMVNKASKDGTRNYSVTSRVYETAKLEHREQVSKIHKGKIRSEETRKKASESLKGKIPWNKGLTGIHTKENLEMLSKIQRGRKDSEETRRKKSISASNRRKVKIEGDENLY
jgi:hypothetical protein